MVDCLLQPSGTEGLDNSQLIASLAEISLEIRGLVLYINHSIIFQYNKKDKKKWKVYQSH